MEKFDQLTGPAAPLAMANIDTDQIIPKQFLKTIDREGLGEGLFYDFRYDMEGVLKPDFVLNQPAYKGVKMLVAGDNFGCGSSREHAPWALMDFGIRCVISTSFADIFFNNCFSNGLLPVVLKADEVHALMGEAKGGNHVFAVDLEAQTVVAPSGQSFHFDIDPSRKEKMLKGLDAIGETLEHAADIDRFEQTRRMTRLGRRLIRPGGNVMIVLTGSIRLPAKNFKRALPVLKTLIETTRKEDGCVAYAFGVDVLDPNTIVITEAWRDAAALAAHLEAPHFLAWRDANPGLEISDRHLTVYETSSAKAL